MVTCIQPDLIPRLMLIHRGVVIAQVVPSAESAGLPIVAVLRIELQHGLGPRSIRADSLHGRDYRMV